MQPLCSIRAAPAQPWARSRPREARPETDMVGNCLLSLLHPALMMQAWSWQPFLSMLIYFQDKFRKNCLCFPVRMLSRFKGGWGVQDGSKIDKKVNILMCLLQFPLKKLCFLMCLFTFSFLFFKGALCQTLVVLTPFSLRS